MSDVRELPPVGSLKQEQVRGVRCVWCAARLHNGTAVDLGARPLRILDHRSEWFPRCCPDTDACRARETEKAGRS